MGQHIIGVGTDRGVVALHHGVALGVLGRDVEGGIATLGNPQVSPAVEQPDVGMPEQGEYPQCVRGPPVGLVSVDDDGILAADSLAVHQFCELCAVNVIPDRAVVQVDVPVDFHRAGYVPDVVEKNVLIGLHDGQSGVPRCPESQSAETRRSGCA